MCSSLTIYTYDTKNSVNMWIINTPTMLLFIIINKHIFLTVKYSDWVLQFGPLFSFKGHLINIASFSKNKNKQKTPCLLTEMHFNTFVQEKMAGIGWFTSTIEFKCNLTWAASTGNWYIIDGYVSLIRRAYDSLKCNLYIEIHTLLNPI